MGQIDFPVFDADNHMYEPPEAFTKYLPAEFSDAVKYVEVKGRTKLAINNVITDFIPNPTFEMVAAPGAAEEYFRHGNPDGKPAKDLWGGAIRAPESFFSPEPRITLMDELGVDRAIMWPTLASLIEERLASEPEATHAVMHALNQWMHEHWTFNYQDRIFPTPVITLPIVDQAIAELEWVVERGARIILVRPAPVPGIRGERSFAVPEFDPFWEKVVEADVTVGMHASDDGMTKYVNRWAGIHTEMQPFKRKTTSFDFMMLNLHRGIHDAMMSAVAHGMLTRFPTLRVMPVENGASWVGPLLHALEHGYRANPHLFDEDPVAVFKRNVWVHPFHEEDPFEIVRLIGADRVVFGSDYPHPEGLAQPTSFVEQLEGLPHDDVARIMGGNLADVMKIAA